jgi:hypothetical protein
VLRRVIERAAIPVRIAAAALRRSPCKVLESSSNDTLVIRLGLAVHNEVIGSASDAKCSANGVPPGRARRMYIAAMRSGGLREPAHPGSRCDRGLTFSRRPRYRLCLGGQAIDDTRSRPASGSRRDDAYVATPGVSAAGRRWKRHRSQRSDVAATAMSSSRGACEVA